MHYIPFSFGPKLGPGKKIKFFFFFNQIHILPQKCLSKGFTSIHIYIYNLSGRFRRVARPPGRCPVASGRVQEGLLSPAIASPLFGFQNLWFTRKLISRYTSYINQLFIYFFWSFPLETSYRKIIRSIIETRWFSNLKILSKQTWIYRTCYRDPLPLHFNLIVDSVFLLPSSFLKIWNIFILIYKINGKNPNMPSLDCWISKSTTKPQGSPW